MSEQIDVSGPMYRPSKEDDLGVDPGMKRLLYLAGAGGLAIMAGIAAYSLTGHSSSGPPPVVQADSRPLRVKPENPGGMVVGPEAKRSDPSQSSLAPGTEEPNPKALLAIAGPAKMPLPPALVAPPRSKSVTVQLTATKSEAEAQAAWNRLAKRLPEVFGAHRPLFQKASESGPAPWRLRTSGFADTGQAKAFCDKVKAKGAQCALVDS